MLRTVVLPAVLGAGTLTPVLLYDDPLKWLAIGLVLLITGLLLKLRDACGRDE